jgi:hypothetical protein
MKHVLLILLFLGVRLSGEEDRSAGDPVTRDESTGDSGSGFKVVNDPDGKPYFPKGKESYYTTIYRAAGLPSLQSLRLGKDETKFRVAYLPSRARPLFLSYSRDKDGGVISIIRLAEDFRKREMANPIELQGAVRLKPEAAATFERIASLPDVRNPFRTLAEELKPLYEGLDGQTWVLEVATHESYTMTAIQSPASFENAEMHFREVFENQVRVNPSAFNLPDRFKDYQLPDLDMTLFVELCEDLLKFSGVQLVEDLDEELPRFSE